MNGDMFELNESELIALEERLTMAQKCKDEGALLELVSPGFTGVGPHGKSITRDLLIQAYTSPDFIMHSIEIDYASVQISGRVGTILGRSTFCGAYNFDGSAEFMDTWHHSAGKWQLVGSDFTPI